MSYDENILFMINSQCWKERSVMRMGWEEQVPKDYESIVNFLSNQLKMMPPYSISINHKNRSSELKHLTQLLKCILKHTLIKLENKHRDPVPQVFELLKKLISQSIGTERQQFVLQQAQSIFQTLLNKIANNIENQKVIKGFDHTQNHQVQCFEELFRGTKDIFNLEEIKNIRIINSLNFEMLNTYSHTFWLYLASIVLPEEQPSNQKAQLIVKFLNIAWNNLSIAALHYIEAILNELLSTLVDGVPQCSLWYRISQITNLNFDQFIRDIVNANISNFMKDDHGLIRKSYTLFSTIFSRKYLTRVNSFQKYYPLIQVLLKNINNTILYHHQNFKLRIELYRMISQIWVDDGHISFLYQLYQSILEPTVRQPNSLEHFFRYLVDLTGILQPIQSHETFKTLGEILIKDLEMLLPLHLGAEEGRNIAYNNQQFTKIWIDFVYELINDEAFRLHYLVQSQLPLKIQSLFKPYLIELLNFNYPPKLLEVWSKYLKLNPLSPLLPLHPSMKQKNNPQYRGLLYDYFENLYKLKNFEEFMFIYEFIEDKIDLLEEWWEEAMIRNYKPNVDVRGMVGRKIWSTKRQKQRLGKMLYRISHYDQDYWRVPDNLTEKHYIEWFVLHME